MTSLFRESFRRVAIAWVAPAQSNETTNRLRDEIESGTRIVEPGRWMFEVANALLVLKRRARLDSQYCAQARGYLIDLSPVIDDDGVRLALNKISELAEKHALSIYDAMYLELALRRGMPLASRDSALNKAAKVAGVKTLLCDQ
ncbi:MAG TPA: type II toxin-antitoxin system VapC family toxin [Bryobacteraceae bacterium]|nr:type II toxin-antitoxin system VapC family toxin [Bryobacteraceae bacterium]